MTKEECILQIDEKYDDLILWFKEHDDNAFDVVTREGKWTAGQHLEHLILSTKPINQVLQLPKTLLKLKFGVCNREEREIDQIVKKYKAKLKTMPSIKNTNYDPRSIDQSEKQELLQSFDAERQRLKKIIQKWSEQDLSKYVLPHPLLGRMTIRELLAFVAFHITHHKNTLIKFH